MLEAVQARLHECDYAIFAAAVANYRPAAVTDKKLKAGETMTLEMIRNPDIAAWAGQHRNGSGQVLIGFAAESENLLEYARGKLERKNLDLIVANAIGVPGIGFTAEDNEVTLIDKRGGEQRSGKMPKDQVARWIWGKVMECPPQEG
jgi:phosphopantothenoylcysteine decarboxylase/phosphopantothenate--cysteine ligase